MNLPAGRAARLLPIVAAFLASCSTVPPGEFSAGEKTYMNPVLDRDFPDPAVLKATDGWFYVYGTQSESGERMFNIQVARSRDLVQWEHLGDALPEKPRWATAKQVIWAPHVIHDPSLHRYVMYYSAEPDKDSGKCLAVASSNQPSGPFVDSGEPLLCGERFEHIDPMAFDDPKTGKRLLYWGSASKPIRVRELAADRVRFAPDSAVMVLIFPDPQRPYSSLVEGAWVTYRNGTYYLFYSGDRCCGPKANYALMVARAKDALGPFELLGAPILERSAEWHAPGHNSVVTDNAGDEWILYHAYRVPAGEAGPRDRARVLLLDRIVYQEDWPRIAGKQPSAIPQRAPALTRR